MARPKVNWRWDRVTDWQAPLREIAGAAGCSISTASRERQLRKIPKRKNRIPGRIYHWDRVTDWTATLAVIAEEAGCSTFRAYLEKKARGVPPNKRGKRPMDAGDIDWGRPDCELRHVLGVTRQAVEQLRKKYTNTYSRRGKVYFHDGTPWGEKEVA